jgi:hypothetical protein
MGPGPDQVLQLTAIDLDMPRNQPPVKVKQVGITHKICRFRRPEAFKNKEKILMLNLIQYLV